MAAPIELRRALAIAGSFETTAWLLRPYIERRALVLMIGAEGTLKSFLALHWALAIATAGEPVVFLSAEGRGLSKRLRAWCAVHRPTTGPAGWVDALHATPFYAVERPLNLSDSETLLALVAAIDELNITPSLIVIDTLTRNSDGLVERSNEDFLKYLNLVDNALRIRYGASVLLVHHTGHAAAERARGPSALSQATDANFLLTRPDPMKRIVTVKAGRMKDCEPPPPFEIDADIVTLETFDEDGKPETSLAIRYTGNEPMTSSKRPTGKQQLALLAELERLAAQPCALGIWTIEELRAVARSIGMSKGSARAAVLGLQQLGYFVPTIGGSRLQFNAQGPKGQNGDKRTTLTPAVEGQKGHTPSRCDHLTLPMTPTTAEAAR
jgi:hypothetical protein